jgi:hypothetical protein
MLGFFPKKVAPRTEWFKNTVVHDICSVSDCISKGPENWIDKWKHNTTTWMFDNPESARSVLELTDAGFTVFAYRVFPILFDGEKTQPWDVSPAASCDLSEFEFLGYDIVSRYGGTNFSCSPLSCNNGCETIPVNEHCLIDELETGWETAKRIAAESNANGTWEPGPYCLVEVWRERSGGEQAARTLQRPVGGAR